MALHQKGDRFVPFLVQILTSCGGRYTAGSAGTDIDGREDQQNAENLEQAGRAIEEQDIPDHRQGRLQEQNQAGDRGEMVSRLHF